MDKQTEADNRQLVQRRWLILVGLLVAVAIAIPLVWPYLSFLTDREALREIILGAGPWAPIVYILLQLLQVVIAPIPGTVISLAGGYIFETFLSTLYAMIGTTLGFLIVFTLSKRYGRRAIKYFAKPESVAKYDQLATSKGSFVFIALGFLFPFIPDPVLGYIAGTTPISTKVLMIIAVVMRTPGVLMTSLVGSQFGQGNYITVVVLVVLLAAVLIISLIFYKQISAWADRLYAMAMRDSARAHKVRRRKRVISEKQKRARRRKRKAIQKRVSKAVSARTKASSKRRKKVRNRSRRR